MAEPLNAVFRKVPEGYIGWVEEIPGANVQEATLVEARASLSEAVRLVLAANRELSRSRIDQDPELIREPMRLDPAA
jgi:predicted RNase H-like HicB family nuclease